MSCAADRLAALDMADVDGAGHEARDVVSLLSRWLAPAHRVRLTARFQLFVEATRDPEILELLAGPRQAFVVPEFPASSTPHAPCATQVRLIPSSPR